MAAKKPKNVTRAKVLATDIREKLSAIPPSHPAFELAHTLLDAAQKLETILSEMDGRGAEDDPSVVKARRRGKA